MTMHHRVQSSHTPKAYPASQRQYLFIDRSARSFLSYPIRGDCIFLLSELEL